MSIPVSYIESEKSRSIVYNVFSALFCQPDKELIRHPTLFEKLEEAFQSMDSGLVKMIRQLRTAPGKYSDTELLVEYSRLFVGPFKTLAPPYSSVYLGSKDSVFSEETIWVMQFYKKAGLDFNRDIHDLPDHIAVELEFIYFLLYNEVVQMQEKDPKSAKRFHDHQVEFISKHFRKWVPEFCDTVIRETKNDYYQLLAECMKSFTEMDILPEFPQ